MSRLDIYRKQAKQLVRWHREGNHSVGGRIRGLARYTTLTDRAALALAFPLREAQEIIAECLHLKFVHEPVFAIGTHDREGLIMAFIEVENIKALYASYMAAAMTFEQKLRKEAWGGRDFIVRDADGNGICFVEPAV